MLDEGVLALCLRDAEFGGGGFSGRGRDDIVVFAGAGVSVVLGFEGRTDGERLVLI